MIRIHCKTFVSSSRSHQAFFIHPDMAVHHTIQVAGYKPNSECSTRNKFGFAHPVNGIWPGDCFHLFHDAKKARICELLKDKNSVFNSLYLSLTYLSHHIISLPRKYITSYTISIAFIWFYR